MYETPILFTCKKCGWVDLPENFHGVHKYNENGPGVPMRMIYVGCPKCENEVFFSHFAIWHDPEPINYDETRVSMGHEFPNEWQHSEFTTNSEDEVDWHPGMRVTKDFFDGKTEAKQLKKVEES